MNPGAYDERSFLWLGRIINKNIHAVPEPIRLREALAAHKRNTRVASYNALNKPEDEYHYLTEWVEKAIRGADPDHILFLDGNMVCIELFWTSIR
ncbi:uncharacterized protein EI90DRAFT_3125280 [Cantharellus anzutake]|uniref:uncharacterized protein n=1 Tax=Cantharellus anzutake TaxID=1750568 RepID=UPI0019037EBD|nr:uncharacterized protein EI90DRAFT_3125280 [Cantharellus anzutake]KAF8329523.1 hypothetical protein EI90DRAFT_3125280 [Cantharellus anzutake]